MPEEIVETDPEVSEPRVVARSVTVAVPATSVADIEAAADVADAPAEANVSTNMGGYGGTPVDGLPYSVVFTWTL